jgi:hypothetical protein
LRGHRREATAAKAWIACQWHESTSLLFQKEWSHVSEFLPGKILDFALVAATFVSATTSAIAQDYPNQRVTIIVPFSAGSISDGFARIIVNKLGEMWKQQVIVENRPGLPGTAAVAKSAPDGYTLMLTSNGHTIASAVDKSPQFDPIKDFAGISLVGSVPLVVIVPPDLPVKNVRDFIALAKEKPGTLNFSSAGVASTTYLSTEIFKQNAKIDIQHIPYRGRAGSGDRSHPRRGAAFHGDDPLRAGACRGQQGAPHRDQLGETRTAASRRADDRRIGSARLQI